MCICVHSLSQGVRQPRRVAISPLPETSLFVTKETFYTCHIIIIFIITTVRSIIITCELLLAQTPAASRDLSSPEFASVAIQTGSIRYHVYTQYYIYYTILYYTILYYTILYYIMISYILYYILVNILYYTTFTVADLSQEG